MKRYDEYKLAVMYTRGDQVVQDKTLNNLNALGNDSWEIAGVISNVSDGDTPSGTCILKKEKKDTAN